MTNYYVSTTGSDSSNGSALSPFRSINHAVNYSGLSAGDTIIVKPGTYTETVHMQKDGAADGYITLQSEVPGQALIRPPSGAYSTLNIRADYVVVDGFDIVGGGGHGIDADNVHHTVVRNNTVHDSGGSGIQYNYSEFITVEGNNVYGNSATNGYETSGISIFKNANVSGDTTTEGFRTIVRNNISHDNQMTIDGGSHQDGNGIIIDYFNQPFDANPVPYKYPTLVESNLVYENGNRGIHVAWSDNVTVSNNTAYHNFQDPQSGGTWRGELSNHDGSNNTWVNNIAVADPTTNPYNTAIGNYGTLGPNQNTVWYDNLTFNGTSGQASMLVTDSNQVPSAADGNLLGVDPKLADPAGFDFSLRFDSPAIDAGNDRFGLGATDVDGGARVVNTVDIGAYEAGSSDTGTAPPPAPTEPTPPATSPTPVTDLGLVLHVSGDQYQGTPQFNVIVDGTLVATNLEATGHHSQGQWTDVTVAGDFTNASKVEVVFTNDNYGGSTTADRNLYVDYIEVAGKRYEGETVISHSASPDAAVLWANGAMTFTTTDFLL